MSLLIKDMSMPKSCKYCLCREYPKFSFESDWCCLNQKTISDVKVISPNCPLIKIPTPHGRLIDVDKLYKKFKNEYCNRNCDSSIQGKKCDHCGVPRALNIILNAPTIIEAEVSE